MDLESRDLTVPQYRFAGGGEVGPCSALGIRLVCAG
jgi:hypothetical protein